MLTLLFKKGNGFLWAVGTCQLVTRGVPVDVLGASPARRSTHALGHGIGTASQGLKTPLNASRVARLLI